VNTESSMTPNPHREAGARPIRATNHCRHYSYERGLKGGPRCARGVVLEGAGCVLPCLPDPSGTPCSLREEYTDAEREAWKAESAASMDRLGKAVTALPRAIPLNTSGKIECPNCGGNLHYGRWHRGAEIRCETPFCANAHFSIAAGKDWPA
jgi:hypothetical protein